MNILTFDVEEWFFEKELSGGNKSVYEKYDYLLEEILAKLDEVHVKGTFFCLGQLAHYFPNVIKKIADAGHEIGCHSNIHKWLNIMTYDEVFEDTRIAIDSLEQCVGQKVTSYRAPAFSVGKSNPWVFEILAANGITRDSSVYTSTREFGGFPGFGAMEPAVVRYNGISIHEFPIQTIKVAGFEMAYSGGGYFRVFPYGFIMRNVRKASYAMMYFHLGDMYSPGGSIMPREMYEAYYNEPGTLKARCLRYIKTNLGVKSAKKKLFNLLDGLYFNNIDEVDNSMDWDDAPVINLSE